MNSNLAAKAFGIIVMVLLVVPALLVKPNNQASVLGVTESKDGLSINANNNTESLNSENNGGLLQIINNNINTEESDSQINNIGSIGSGAIDVKNLVSEEEITESKAFTGKIIHKPNQSTSVISDKFSLGSTVITEINNQSYNLVVSDNTQLLGPEEVLYVNTDTFIKLGGDPDETSEINALVSLDR